MQDIVLYEFQHKQPFEFEMLNLPGDGFNDTFSDRVITAGVVVMMGVGQFVIFVAVRTDGRVEDCVINKGDFLVDNALFAAQ
jgi:hypothetical protein